MYVGVLEMDVVLGDLPDLDAKRSFLRPVLAELRRRHGLSIREVDNVLSVRRTVLGLAWVGLDEASVYATLDDCEQVVGATPGLQLLAVRRRFIGPQD